MCSVHTFFSHRSYGFPVVFTRLFHVFIYYYYQIIIGAVVACCCKFVKKIVLLWFSWEVSVIQIFIVGCQTDLGFWLFNVCKLEAPLTTTLFSFPYFITFTWPETVLVFTSTSFCDIPIYSVVFHYSYLSTASWCPLGFDNLGDWYSVSKITCCKIY